MQVMAAWEGLCKVKERLDKWAKFALRLTLEIQFRMYYVSVKVNYNAVKLHKVRVGKVTFDLGNLEKEVKTMVKWG